MILLIGLPPWLLLVGGLAAIVVGVVALRRGSLPRWRITTPRTAKVVLALGITAATIGAVLAVAIARSPSPQDTTAAPPQQEASSLPAASSEVAAAETDAPATTDAVASGQGDPAWLLAQRDGSTDVAAYSTALDQLQPYCTQDRVQLARLGDAGYSDLEQNSIHDETRLNVLQHLRDSIPSGSFKLDCQGVLAAYLVLREKG